MNFFSTSYDKNYEVFCAVPIDDYENPPKLGDTVRFIDKKYVTPVLFSRSSGPSPDRYKFYINKTDVDKILVGTIVKMSTEGRNGVYYDIKRPDGRTTITSGSYHKYGSDNCRRNSNLFFLRGKNPPTGGKRRYTRKQRKTRKSNRRVKSYKRRK
jgi:hypothetical protein